MPKLGAVPPGDDRFDQEGKTDQRREHAAGTAKPWNPGIHLHAQSVTFIRSSSEFRTQRKDVFVPT